MPCDLRDYQKTRVYDAEDVVWGAVSHTVPLFTDEDSIVAFVNKVLRYKRVNKKFAQALDDQPDIEIKYCSRSTWSEADFDRIKIAAKAPAHALLVIHELAHVFQYRLYPDTQVSAHGPEFCQIYLQLVRIVFGVEIYLLLQESMDKHGVDY
jgi:putative metallohydrolase (TIGR04338 family)